ncbi:hypothetical protein P9139_12590 [Curtobacterium flaccumfaciens]|nr:hypothetical protein P9139_12590 [Curtobacterium flaccumfaciens]
MLVDPTPAEVVAANRRALHLVVVRTPPVEVPWSSRAHRTGADAIATLVDSAVDVVTERGALEDAADQLERCLLTPTEARSAVLERRWAALLPLDLTAAEVASDSAADEVTRLRRELDDLRASRSFRTGQAIAKVAARLPGRR